ncbi:glycosyltransferase, partial [Priestia megaterium]|uniref:glycosyltransferase n=1 Tax=Priestia megaterium TaxID=1404 RepID=UPI003000E02E
MLISIIVPVYNAEKFLPKSLESLQNQTYTELEIILVNDGSNDGSAAICEHYASKDKRFVVIHKENGGVSSARNAGLKRVTGKYVGFVDPDDWIEPNMFKRLYQLAQEYNADISMCGYMKQKADGTVLNTLEPSNIISLTPEEALNNILNDKSFKG